METKKIAIACFIGGFICAAVALAVNPVFWWMGMLAGFTAGYLSYEFRSVLHATPVAWKSAKKSSGIVGQEIKNLLREWIFKKHPVWHPLVIIFCFLNYVSLPIIVSRIESTSPNAGTIEFVSVTILMCQGYLEMS